MSCDPARKRFVGVIECVRRLSVARVGALMPIQKYFNTLLIEQMIVRNRFFIDYYLKTRTEAIRKYHD